MSRRARRNALITLYRCGNGHVFFHRHDRCPSCGQEVTETEHPAAATIVSQTTVRVSPKNGPFRLGIAQVACGAQTLCLIEHGVSDEDGAPVTLQRRNDLFYAGPPWQAEE